MFVDVSGGRDWASKTLSLLIASLVAASASVELGTAGLAANCFPGRKRSREKSESLDMIERAYLA